MNVWMRPRAAGCNRPGGLLEVGAVAASQARDHRPADLGGDAAHRLGIGGRGDREAGLDDVDTEGVELTGELQLLGRAQRKAGRLFAVTQRRVENQNPVCDRPFRGALPACQ